MSVRSKVMLMNAAILTGLAFRYWKGTPFRVVALTGIFIVVIANLLVVIIAGKQTAARG